MEATTQPVEAANTGASQAEPSQPENTPVLSLMERLRARAEAEAKDESGTEVTEGTDGTSTPGTEAQGTEDKPAPEPPKAKPSEDERIELEYGRALERERKLTSEVANLRKVATELTSIKEKAKRDPLGVMGELYGEDWRAILQRASKGEFDRAKTPQLPPEITERLAYLDQLKAREEAREKEAQRKADMEADKPRLQAFLADKASEYPVLAAFDEAPEIILEDFYDSLASGTKRTIPELLKEREAAGVETATTFLTNKKLLAHLVANNASIKSALMEALTGSPKVTAQQAESSRAGTRAAAPRTLAATTEVPTRSDRDQTAEEERAESLRLFRAHKAGMRI